MLLPVSVLKIKKSPILLKVLTVQDIWVTLVDGCTETVSASSET